MIRTRKKAVGREPSLRDQILELLLDSGRPMTAREIAEYLNVNKTTPFRPLSDLVGMQLVIKDEEGIDGAEFSANREAAAIMEQGPRRTK